MRRYFFVSNDIQKASGGRSVIYDIAATLCENGFDASVLHGTPNMRYQGGREDVPLSYSPRMPKARLHLANKGVWLHEAAAVLRKSLARGPNEKVTFRPDDVIVIPEILVQPALIAFPDQPKILLSQNPFSYRRARAQAISQGHDPDGQLFWHLGTSLNCIDTLKLVGVAHHSYIRVRPDLEAFPYRAEKKKLITYMPRKRQAEATLITDALQRRGKLGGYDLQAIDGMPQRKVAEMMADSLIFVSLMRTEALGFPGMEAMSTGAIVIGYTGFGAREYFDDTTGLPILEGDSLKLVETVEEVVAEYDRDPGRFDALRAHAAQTINARYTRDQFVADVQTAFTDINAALDARQ